MIKKTITNIGLLDYDTTITRYYIAPNYDLGVTYAYLKKDKNINVRLISSLGLNNLKQYDKIYIFKQTRLTSPPMATIIGYAYLPMEEYGPGFYNKPLRPFQEETRFTQPDFTCYNNMLRFSLEKPNHYLSWRMNRNAKGGKYKPIRLYEEVNGEELKKDFPTERYNMIYDDPADIILNPEKLEYYMSFLKKHYVFAHAQAFDVGRVNDTNILERVMTEREFAPFRRKMIASKLGDGFQWLVSNALSNNFKKGISIMVKLPVSEGTEKCLETLLLMNYYNRRAKKHTLNLRPIWEDKFLETNDLAHLAYKYMAANPAKMSFYKYVIYVGYRRMGIPNETVKMADYNYLLEHYGVPPAIVKLERWITQHPEFEEHVLIGGYRYEEQRKKYNDIGRSEIAFRASSNHIGEERSS